MKNPQGNLSNISFPRLLHSIFVEGDACGVLDVHREPIKKRFFFKKGQLVSSTSNVLGEVLGRLLMDEGIITQKDYEESLEKVIKEKRRHGEVLISMGIITPEKLDMFLKLQLKRRLLNTFSWSEGTYQYIRTEEIPAELKLMHTHPGRLILEGISLGFYPPERVKDDLRESLDRPMILSEKALEKYSLDDFGLNLQEKRFLKMFDGTKTLGEVLDSSDLLKHRALSVALTTLLTGVIHWTEGTEEDWNDDARKETVIVDTPPETRMGAELRFMRARSAIIDGEYKKAAELLEQITELNPIEGEYWAYLGWAIFNAYPSRIEEAEKIIKDALDLNNELDHAWYFIGRIFLAKGDAEWAERAFSTSVNKNPWMLEALAELKRMELGRTEADHAELQKTEHRGWSTRLGFSEDPFTPIPDEKFHIPVENQAKIINELVQCIKKKTGPLLLIGEPGTGKTTVLLDLLKKLSYKKVLATVVLKPPQRELDLIKTINREAGASMDSESVKEQLFSLGMKLSQNKIHGGHNLVVIDNAHSLTDGCLKLVQYLSRLKTLQVLLISDPTLTERLRGPLFAEINEKFTSRMTLGHLSREETREYIETRLRRAKRSNDKPLENTIDESALESIHTRSDGVPALINRYASEHLATESDLSVHETAHVYASSAAAPVYSPDAETSSTEVSAWDEPSGDLLGNTPELEEASVKEKPLEADDAEATFKVSDLDAMGGNGGGKADDDFKIFGNKSVAGSDALTSPFYGDAGTGNLTEAGQMALEREEAAEECGGLELGEADEMPFFGAEGFAEDTRTGEGEPKEEAFVSASEAGTIEATAEVPSSIFEATSTVRAEPAEDAMVARDEEPDENPLKEPSPEMPRKKRRKKSFIRLIVLLIIMLSVGLVIGSSIGLIHHGPEELLKKVGIVFG